MFIKRYGVEKLLDCLEENEKTGLYIIVREFMVIMTHLMMLISWLNLF